MTDRAAEVEALLKRAEDAHGEYERTELDGVYDEEWPRWYAQYAVEHGIGPLLGRDVAAEELGQLLSRSWDEYRAVEPAPAEQWSAYVAGRLVADA